MSLLLRSIPNTVAKKLNRKAVGYELSDKYCDLIIKRNRQQVMI
jgi:hypothetical protein